METAIETTTGTYRFAKGFGWGVVATLAMSALMLAVTAIGASPLPGPVPVAIMGAIVGSAVAKPLVMGAAVTAHLAYGGFWGGVLASATSRVTVTKGVGLGVALWLVMQVVVLPLVGWGVFGTGVTPAIAVATLVPHLVYGATLGWLVDR